MFKLLSLNQLLAQPFYHKTEGCAFIFQKAISKHFIFSEFSPKTPYQKRYLSMSLEELFSSQDMGIQNGGGGATPVYTFFEKQYADIENKLGGLKTASEIRELLASIDPFLSSADILTNINNVKLAKSELASLLEEDKQELVRLQKGKAADARAEFKAEELYPTKELGNLKTNLIELEADSGKSPLSPFAKGGQGDFAPMLENVYARNEKGVKRELRGSLLPFLELLTADYTNSRLSVLASDMEIEPPHASCQMELVKNKDSVAKNIGGIFGRSAVATARFSANGGQSLLALLGISSKADAQYVLVKLRIDFGQEIGGILQHFHQKKNLNKFFTGPELYADIYYGLSGFLDKRSCLLDGSDDMEGELKNKADALLQAADICQEYAKLLPALDKPQIRYVLTYLMNKKPSKIEELILSTFSYYLKQIKNAEEFQAAFNYLKGLKTYADSAGVSLRESGWGTLIADIEALRGSSAIDGKLAVLLLKFLFGGSIFLAAYQKFSEMENAGIVFTDEYASIGIKMFDYRNWQEEAGNYAALKPEFKTALITFMLQEAHARLEKQGRIEDLREINRIMGSLNLQPTESDLTPLLAGIWDRVIKDGQPHGSAEEIADCFKVVELFFANSFCLAAYSQFSQICMAGERFLNCDYMGIGLNIFDYHNWLKDKTPPELNQDLKDVIKKFAVQQMASLLPDTQNRQKIGQNKAILDKLGISLAVPEDVQPILEAIENSPLKDNAAQQIKNGQGLQEYFDILADFIKNTRHFYYYKAFAEVKLGQYNFSDFQYVNAALKILDYRNWDQNSINEKTRQEIKQVYFATFLNPKLGRDDKIANLNVLHSRLKITIASGERDELGKHVKDRIEGLVDLLNAMGEMASAATK